MSDGELILYTAADGRAAIHLRAENGTVWLTQMEMAALFDTTKQNISLHIKNILEEQELVEAATVKQSLTVQTEGRRPVRRTTLLYNLDMILAVGYRVRSPRGTQFRQWATIHLREYLVKGFVLDDARLKEPGGWDYFDELLARIREIRASEKRFYQKVRDIDVTVAKNYLQRPEIEELDRIVVMYLDYAEDQASRRRAMTMREWEEKLDAFLQFNERDVLTHAGKLRAEVAEQLALERYESFDAARRLAARQAADVDDLAALERTERELEGKGPPKTR